MEQVMKNGKMKVKDHRVATLRLEIDYELATLFEAMTENDETKKMKCKKKLEKLNQEMQQLKLSS